jgi:copper chaperone CopZ
MNKSTQTETGIIKREGESITKVKVRKMTKQITLKIVGMHCAGCAFNVEKALQDIPGVTAAKVNLNAAKAVVDFEPDKTNEKEMAKAVKQAGFNIG